VLMVSFVFVTAFALLASVLNGSGKARTAMVLGGAAVVIAAVVSLVLVRHWGLTGAAIGTGSGALVGTIGAAVAVHRVVPLQVRPASVLRISVASLVVLGLAFVHWPWPIWAQIGWWVVIGVVYLGLLFGSREITAADRAMVLGLVPGRRARTP
jgi:O-antigen/teichoic acid export membrane protein